jgi:hypothetical protein
LYQPSSRLPELVPRFDFVREAIRDKNTLSIAIYLKSCASDSTLDLNERKKAMFGINISNFDLNDASVKAIRAESLASLQPEQSYRLHSTARCALQLEERWAPGFERVVWFLAADDLRLKRSFAEAFGEEPFESSGPGRRVLWVDTIPRNTKPRHAKLHHNSYTQGVADAITDWWLLGEADIGLLGSSSCGSITFGLSAFARGSYARSLFIADGHTHLATNVTKAVEQQRQTNCGDETQFVPIWR